MVSEAVDLAPDAPETRASQAPKPTSEAEAGNSGPSHADNTRAAYNDADKTGGDASIETSSETGARPRKIASHLKSRLTEKAEGVKEKTSGPAGGFDTTPLPDYPAGYTVKFTFHGASNLPRGDLTTASSDPFIHATLTADIPRRHKEDPVLTYRTRTLRKTTEPSWEQDWIVANIPRSGFRLKCRLYDEDYPDRNDRLGNVTYLARRVDEDWEGVKRRNFQVKKRVGSKRAYLAKAVESAFTRNGSITPLLQLSVEVLGRSDGPGAHMYTVGPTAYIQHFSPMIGRLTGVKVNKDADKDEKGQEEPNADENTPEDRETKKYDFQAIEMQLQGPVPPQMYHRYVEFSRFVGPMFSSHGIRGKLLNKVLHKQHRRVYNFDHSTKYGTFPACSTEAALQFLRLAHFDEGGRIFTYILTLDGLFRFTETGKEFGIDMLSKHTMHSDVSTYIACSGEFFIRRMQRPDASSDPDPPERMHPADDVPGGPPESPPPGDPRYYQLVIDNDSGTYRPDKSILPELTEFLRKNFPGLGIAAMHWEDEGLKSLKAAQHEAKKKEGRGRVRMVLNRSPSGSSFSSSDESRLADLDYGYDDDYGAPARKTKKEIALDVVEDPRRIRTIKEHAFGKKGGGDKEAATGGPAAASSAEAASGEVGGK